jgi:hypothetical protein
MLGCVGDGDVLLGGGGGGVDWFRCIVVGLCRSGLVHMEVCRLL